MRLAFLALSVLFLLRVPSVQAQATFTVTTIDNSGPGSLRQAILDANARGGRDRIVFDIPANECDAETGVCTILPLRNLPEVTGAVEIDGLTQPEADCDVWPPRLLIELSGSEIDEVAQGESGKALKLTGGSSLVQGLVINNFSALIPPGIGADGLTVEGDDNEIDCTFVAVSADGMEVRSIGGTSAIRVNGDDNVITRTVAGNIVSIEGARNRIQQNYTGVMSDGMALLAASSGVCSGSLLSSGSESLVGGTGEGEGNVVGCGLGLFGTNHQVMGNRVGTTADGMTALGNSLVDLQLFSSASNNMIGGTEPGARNIVAGAIELSGADDNVVQGNYVGVDATGMQVLGGGNIELRSGASGNFIGGSDPAARNILAGELYFFDTHDNTVQGNYVGVDHTGMATFPDRDDSIGALSLSRSSGNLIGGSGAGEGNVFVGTSSHGRLRESNDNRILGNRFGTNADGTEDLGDDLFTSVEIAVNSSGNQIGGEEPGAGNTIASARSGALSIERASFENTVLGNVIGTTPDGTQALPSFGPGIVLDSVFNNVIGSLSAPNTIAYQLEEGVLITGGGAGNTLSANRIYGNGGLGINLDGGSEDALGVTANDPDGNDDPALPNGLQNYPVLTLEAANDNEATLGLVLMSRPNTRFRLEIFANDTCDASGYGEGHRFLMAQDATVSSSGQSTLSLTTDTSEGDNALTATATGPEGTSEFSACVLLHANAGPSTAAITQPADGAEVTVGGTTTPVDPAETLTVAWTEASDPDGDVVQYRWEVSATEGFSDILFAQEAGAETMLTVSLGELALVLDGAGIELGAAVVLYHRVVASDGSSETAGLTATVILVRGMLVATENEAGVPEQFVLEANYPNPFNPQTTIGFALPQISAVRLVVYDVLGREVVRLLEGMLAAGQHEVVFDAAGLPTGVYLYRLQADGFVQTRRMLLVK